MPNQTEPEVIPVWPAAMPDGELWQGIGPELESQSSRGVRLVRNVSQPTLTAYLPATPASTGTGIIICPGGAFHFLAIDHEGIEVARWFADRGVAAFVLKYRVLPTPPDEAELQALMANLAPQRPRMDRVRPIVVDDGLQAIRRVRSEAARWGIAPDRIGIVGFSAGAHVVVGTATRYDAASRPDFAAAIYGEWWDRRVPADAPPLFLAGASDDEVLDIRSNAALFDAWKTAGRRAELHIYGAGKHGFGMIQQGLPSDGWIERLWEWMRAEGFAAAG